MAFPSLSSLLRELRRESSGVAHNPEVTRLRATAETRTHTHDSGASGLVPTTFTHLVVRNDSREWPAEVYLSPNTYRIGPGEVVKLRTSSATEFKYRAVGAPAELRVFAGQAFDLDLTPGPRLTTSEVEPITSPDSDTDYADEGGTYDDGVPLASKGRWKLVQERGGNRVRLSADGGASYGSWFDCETLPDGAGTRPLRGFITDAGSVLITVYPAGVTSGDLHVYRSADACATFSAVPVYDTDGVTAVETVGWYYNGVWQYGGGGTVSARTICYADYGDDGQPSRIYRSTDDGASFTTVFDGDPALDDSHANSLGIAYRHWHGVRHAPDPNYEGSGIWLASTGDSSGGDSMHWLWSADDGQNWARIENEAVADWTASQAWRTIAWDCDHNGRLTWASDSPGPRQGIFRASLEYDPTGTTAVSGNYDTDGTLTLVKADGTTAGVEGGDLLYPLQSTAYGLHVDDGRIVCATLRNNQWSRANPKILYSQDDGATWTAAYEWPTEAAAAAVFSSGGDGYNQLYPPDTDGWWWVTSGSANEDFSRPESRARGLRLRLFSGDVR